MAKELKVGDKVRIVDNPKETSWYSEGVAQAEYWMGLGDNYNKTQGQNYLEKLESAVNRLNQIKEGWETTIKIYEINGNSALIKAPLTMGTKNEEIVNLEVLEKSK